MGKANCPNCGAPFGLDRICEYCGTSAMDILRMSMNKPVKIAVEHDGVEYIMMLLLENAQFDIHADTTTLYTDSDVYQTFSTFVGAHVKLDARVLPFETEYGRSVYIKKRYSGKENTWNDGNS